MMSNQASTGTAATANEWSEYDLMMQFSNELERRTSEVLALEERNARLVESLLQAEKTNRETRATLEAVLSESSVEPEAPEPPSEAEVSFPIEASPDIDIDECSDQVPSHCGTMLKVLKGLGKGVAVAGAGIVASVATVAFLYDVDFATAATMLMEGISSILF